MGNRQSHRLDPRQVNAAREMFVGGEQLTIGEIAARMSKGKHTVEFTMVRRVLEASGWKRPERTFASLEERHREEIRELIAERGWKPERAAELYGFPPDESEFVSWAAGFNGTAQTAAESPPPKEWRRLAARNHRNNGRPRASETEAAGAEFAEVRNAAGVLLSHPGGAPLWNKRLSETELEELGARFFPAAAPGYKRNRAVIQVMIGCRKNRERENIVRFVASHCRGVERSQVAEMVDWLRGSP